MILKLLADENFPLPVIQGLIEADDLDDLHQQVRDAVHCHFYEGKAPEIIRLHFVREEVMMV